MHVQFLHTTLSKRRKSRRLHLALWRWCSSSPGEECDADSEAVRVILSNITDITIHTNMYSFKAAHAEPATERVGVRDSVRDSTWPSDVVSGAPAALARSATLTARRSASSYQTSQTSPSIHKHACTVSAHDTERATERSETAPGPLTGSLARRQPWRGVRR
jgi:hypothetical protein